MRAFRVPAVNWDRAFMGCRITCLTLPGPRFSTPRAAWNRRSWTWRTRLLCWRCCAMTGLRRTINCPGRGSVWNGNACCPAPSYGRRTTAPDVRQLFALTSEAEHTLTSGLGTPQGRTSAGLACSSNWSDVMFKRVLLCYDGSEVGRRALKRGAELAVLLGAHVYVLSIIPSEVAN